jgi:anaerobic selenocysteine-containing dehydrogenase
VFNDRGRFRAEAQVSDEVRQGVIVAAPGHWTVNTPGERTVNAVNAARYADGRAPASSETRVEVKRLEA